MILFNGLSIERIFIHIYSQLKTAVPIFRVTSTAKKKQKQKKKKKKKKTKTKTKQQQNLCVLTTDAAACWTVNFHEDRILLTLAMVSIGWALGFVFTIILTTRIRESDSCNSYRIFKIKNT